MSEHYRKITRPENINILFITGYFPFQQGGAECQALFLAEQLKKKANVSFIFRDHWGKKTILKENGFTLYPVSPIKIKKISKPYVFEYRQIKRILEHVCPAFIYVRGINAYMGVVARYIKNKDCKLIWHIASDKDVTLLNWEFKKNILFKIMDKKVAEYGMKNADHIIAQTSNQAKLLEKTYHRKCDCVVRNWHPEPENCKKSNDILNILWIANWKPIKQPEHFIQLAKKLSQRPNISLLMVGRTGNYSVLVNKASYYGIKVIGEVSNERVNEFLKKGHIVVNTSKQEGFSNTFIQAWMHKVPVVSLNVDPDNLLKKQGMGLHSGNFEQLVQDTKLLIQDHNLREQMGNKAVKYAKQHHSLINIDKMMKFFTK